MKSKLYYYEMILERKFQDLTEIPALVKDLKELAGFRVIGYDINHKPKKKEYVLKLQLISFKDEITNVDRKLITLYDLHPISFRTRSITGDDLAIIRSFYVIAGVTEASIFDQFTTDKKKEKAIVDEALEQISKEELSNDKESD